MKRASWGPAKRQAALKRRATRMELPCPYCNCEFNLIHQQNIAGDAQDNDISAIVCETCQSWGPWVTGGRSRAVYFWNLRSKDPADLSEDKRIKAPKPDTVINLEGPEDESPVGCINCRFCNSEDLVLYNCGDPEENVWYVCCKNCGGSGPQPDLDKENTRDQAISEWNGSLLE